MNNKIKGLYGEFISYLFLKVKFYQIIERNYRSKLGEIDLIASKKNQLIFVEVKFRSNINEFDQIVSNKQISRIKNSAEIYILKRKLNYKYDIIRFDVIIFRNFFNFIHYKNVW